MAKTWMTAADQNGIPTAFIVNKEGKIAWIGHPMAMEKPFEKVDRGHLGFAGGSRRAAKASEAQHKAIEAPEKANEVSILNSPTRIQGRRSQEARGRD